MNLSVHNITAFNQQYFRPHPSVAQKREIINDKSQSFQDILNEKMRSGGADLNKNNR
ncbi:hypothetical protein SAMN04487895_103209 [Paenibacillus sophorae]|uniref:Uncharacterized protein n=1 Tax=Paenibacillus sophorae TaxID=1333845 RepID=A0A1H8JZL1_9BACL|nr:hypothetical protein [Paenibacillus sophorae]QWU13539.1 hypothetical protein KP014_16215 [Paenibacillus sophorae]SEN85985.1 hypothetical protein SAMN04487895_103209 [Paenibacillus sophorae]